MAKLDSIQSPLQALPRGQIGTLARLLPKDNQGLSVRIVEPLRVLSLRHLNGDAPAIASATSVADLPGPGRFIGSEPLLLWRSPSEWLHIGTQDACADAVLQQLPAGGASHAIDQSAGIFALELKGTLLDALLDRLLDASAQVREPGQGTRTRLADIAVIVLRLAPQQVWLLIDRANDQYLAHWLTYATEALYIEP
ncbi:hypothetical protein [Roseateles toxinivorans]|uniref:Heterotetrameric sarcosine oxidase gamma subunit n=1 Tax=Roseateles toxinivorans TaxID=270368 RepID=A0A4R6QFC3_9BURK|nr:hypothetical protein [Roseateles toxinivorans]TDP61241.1 heterotetrameric sarcosine oxidase gamma subunit [Roseateles toxinivorans]